MYKFNKNFMYLLIILEYLMNLFINLLLEGLYIASIVTVVIVFTSLLKMVIIVSATIFTNSTNLIKFVYFS